MSVTMIYYTIPEDFDDFEQPNAFGIGKPIAEIKLSDIKRLFPIEGTYHFRFKYVSNKNTLWMDLKDDQSIAIAYQNNIVMKVTRSSWESSSVSAQKVPSTSQNGVKPPVLNLFDFEPSLPKKNSENGPQRGLAQFDLLFPQ